MNPLRRLPALLLATGLAACAPALAQFRPDTSIQQLLPAFQGTLRGADSKSLLLEGRDANTVQFHCSRKTKYFDGSKAIRPSDLQPGDRLSVEARHAPDGSLDAVTVRREKGK